MKLYVIKRRANPGTSYRGDGCYCSSMIDAVLYDQPDLAFSALRDLKHGLDIDNKAPDVYVAELEFTDTEVVLETVPVRRGSGFTV